jgi:hypothetical protein
MSHIISSIELKGITSLSLLWLYSPLLGLCRFVSFLTLHTVGRTPSTGDQHVARPLPTHRTAQAQNKRTQCRHSCLKWGSNPRSQCLSGRRPCGNSDRQRAYYTGVHTLLEPSVNRRNLNLGRTKGQEYLQETAIFSLERILHQGYYRKSSAEKKRRISDRRSWGLAPRRTDLR